MEGATPSPSSPPPPPPPPLSPPSSSSMNTHGVVSPRLVRKASNLPPSPAFTTLGLEEADPEDVFEIQSKEGAGAFGRVFRACYRRDRSRLVALKVIPVALEAGQRGEDVENVRREIQFLRECDHPNVVAFYGAYYKDGALWVAMEYCGGGSVADVCRQRALREDEIAVIVRGALRGLAYLHARKKIHRDIKGGNILLTLAGEVKIADFGVSAQLKDTMSRRGTFVGTPYWMSPEMIQDSEYDVRSDIWSLGITMIELADQTPPLFEEHPMRVLIQIPRNPPPQVRHPARWSPLFSQFLAFCLRKNPRERPSALECLEHAFLQRVAHIALVFADGRSGIAEDTRAPGAASVAGAAIGAEAEAAEHTQLHGAQEEMPTEHEDDVDAKDATLRSHRSASSCRTTNQSDALGTPKELSLVGRRSSGLCTPLEQSDAASVSSSASSGSSSSNVIDEEEEEDDGAHARKTRSDECFTFRDSAMRPALKLQLDDDAPPPPQPETAVAAFPAPSAPEVPAIASSDSPITRSKQLPPTASRLAPASTTDSRSLFASFVSGTRQPREIARRRDVDAKQPAHANPLDGIDTSRDRVSQLVQSLSASAAAELKAAAQLAVSSEKPPSVDGSHRATTGTNVSGNASESDNDKAAAQFIGTPFRVAHPVRVSFDTLHARFEGVPDTETWRAIHQQFGVPLATLRCRSGRTDHVPALLEMLRRELLARDGLSAKFVYRVPADQREVQLAKQAINRGAFDPRAITDPHVFASLLKQWLRELPTPLLGNVSRAELVEIQRLVVATSTKAREPSASEEIVWAATLTDVSNAVHSKVLTVLPKAERGVLLWLIDHALEVVAHSKSNAMTAHSLAVVLAPTLYRWAAATPEDAVTTSHQVATLLRVLIEWRRVERSVSDREATTSLTTRWSTHMGASGGASSENVRWSMSGRMPLDERKLTASVRSRAMLRDSFDVQSSSLKSLRGSWGVARASALESSSISSSSRGSMGSRNPESLDVGPQHDDTSTAGICLTTRFQELVDQLWTALPSSLMIESTPTCPPIVRSLHATFQRDVLNALQRFAKREDEHAWATKALTRPHSTDTESCALLDELPTSLRRLRRWLSAALDLSAFVALLRHERAVAQAIDRMRCYPNSQAADPLGLCDTILNLSSVGLEGIHAGAESIKTTDAFSGITITDPGIAPESGSIGNSLTLYTQLLRAGAIRSLPIFRDEHAWNARKSLGAEELTQLGLAEPVIAKILLALGSEESTSDNNEDVCHGLLSRLHEPQWIS